MKKVFALSALLGTFAASMAQASCPQIEGRYTYMCSVQTDPASQFGQILENSGQMMVRQNGCEAYEFYQTASTGRVLDLAEIDPTEEELETKIKVSTDRKIRFKTVSYPAYDAFINLMLGEMYVTKVKIRKTSKGFILKGKEKSRFLGMISDRHSKFACRFDEI
jgi:hypothetical protein